MKNHLERWADSMLRPINTNIISLLGFSTILWGVWIANPFWSVFNKSAVFDPMHFFPEWSWGVLAVIIGVLTLRGAFKPSYSNLHTGSFAAAVHWLIITMAWVIGDWQNPAFILSFTFCIYAAFVCLNINVNRHLYR